MRLRFWGTRGSLVSPGPECARYGGNTPCIQICCDDQSLIVDWGMGIVALGNCLMGGGPDERPTELHLLSSHLHWDHVLGLPFFVPIYIPGTSICFYGRAPTVVQQTIERLFHAAYSPIRGTQNLGATLSYSLVDETSRQIAGFDVRTTGLSHPHAPWSPRSVALRIERAGKVIVYATDHEVEREPEVDDGLVELARGADVFVADAQYTPEEYPEKAGWGHSAFDGTVRLAVRAGVKHLVLFHHKPNRTDQQLDKLLAQARGMAPAELQVTAARDGLELDV